jgi:hypothetical protein
MGMNLLSAVCRATGHKQYIQRNSQLKFTVLYFSSLFKDGAEHT